LADTRDVREWFSQLAPLLAPGSLARILLGPTSPYVSGMFGRARGILEDVLRAEVTIMAFAPSLVNDEGRWTTSRVDLQSGDAVWHVRLVCEYVFGLAVASAALGLPADQVSSVQVREALGVIVTRTAEALREGFEELRTDCRIGISAFQTVNSAPAELLTETAPEYARWLWASTLQLGALVRLTTQGA
jgi:hypothetical protein